MTCVALLINKSRIVGCVDASEAEKEYSSPKYHINVCEYLQEVQACSLLTQVVDPCSEDLSSYPKICMCRQYGLLLSAGFTADFKDCYYMSDIIANLVYSKEKRNSYRDGVHLGTRSTR